MEREVFKSKPLRGLPIGLIRGFMFGCLILLIGLALGMDEELFLPLLGAAMILSGKIGEYDFGFKTDKSWAAEYGQLTEAVKNHFGDKFAYDIN